MEHMRLPISLPLSVQLYHVRLPFSRYLTLKNFLTMRSTFVTHPENLCMIAEMYEPSVIFLLLIVFRL